ncbi:MAG: hypothetical protein ACKOXF_02030 [Chitinophagaceae bacterium]
MKQFLPFIYVLIAQLLLTWFFPGLALDQRDQMTLSIIVIVFCLIFVLGTIRLSTALNVSQSQFNARYFGSMGLRMLIALILIAIYLKSSNVINKAGSIFLLFSYFVYMGFEIRIILHKLRTNSEKSQNTDDARK